MVYQLGEQKVDFNNILGEIKSSYPHHGCFFFRFLHVHYYRIEFHHRSSKKKIFADAFQEAHRYQAQDLFWTTSSRSKI